MIFNENMLFFTTRRYSEVIKCGLKKVMKERKFEFYYRIAMAQGMWMFILRDIEFT